MRQGISVGMADHLFSGLRLSNEIALAGRIAPSPFGIPVPRLHKQFRVLAIADRAPTGFENLFHLIWTEEDIGGVARNTIERCPERLDWTERVSDMAWSRVNLNRLR